MVSLAASQPVINLEDNFLVTNGWTEPELFANPGVDKTPEPKLLQPAPIKMQWNRREYIVNPGETRQVPFDALRLRFGDPRSMMGTDQRFPGEDGRVGIIPRREAEVARLSIVWGLYQQGQHLLTSHPAIKHVRITTVPLGPDQPAVPVWTPATDPDGKHAMYGVPEIEPNRADFLQIIESMETRMKRQEMEIAQLRAAQAGGEAASLEIEDEELEKDLPTFPS